MVNCLIGNLKVPLDTIHVAHGSIHGASVTCLSLSKSTMKHHSNVSGVQGTRRQHMKRNTKKYTFTYLHKVCKNTLVAL